MQRNILEYLEHTVQKYPDKTAFANESEGMTFQEVYQTSRSIGTCLSRKGYGGEPVVIYMKKHPHMIAAFWGVVYSGCFYVPMDEEMPEFRIELIFQNLHPRAVICDESTAGKVKEISGFDGEVLMYDEISVCPSDDALLADVRSRAIDTTGYTGCLWYTSDASIVTVTEHGNGTITAVKAGKVTITACSSEDTSKKATCEVTVTGGKAEEDTKTLLKDKDGRQLYIKKDGKYVEAVVADYFKYDVFYRLNDNVEYKYTGWQTIDGKRYYFDKNGNKVTGKQVIQGVQYDFGADGALSSGSGVLGIDVSKHNGSIDWEKVKNSGVSFVIIRCGYRGSATGVMVEDPKFRSNIQGATAAGLKVGVYYFSQAVNQREAVEEASAALELISGYKISYPVFIDVEAAGGRADGISSADRTAVVQAFCNTIRDSGYTAGVYANKNWLGSKMNTGSFGSYNIWLAQYAAAPTYNGRYEMWQYSSTGKIDGISGNVDLNISYLGY